VFRVGGRDESEQTYPQISSIILQEIEMNSFHKVNVRCLQNDAYLIITLKPGLFSAGFGHSSVKFKFANFHPEF
jgi:hypothetical protein